VSTCAVKSGDGLKEMTYRDEIGNSMPVRGLRPTRFSFERRVKLPNAISLTLSPLINVIASSSRTLSKIRRASLRDSTGQQR